MFPNGDASKFAENIFRTMDTDNNGRLDFREVLMSVSLTQHGTEKERIEWMFNLFDINQTGFIDKDELLTLLKVGYRNLNKPVSQIN